MELKIEHLSKQFKDKTAVNDVNLTLTPGIWGLLGANGAGKTTLMRMIADIMTPTNGAVYYDGKGIRELGEVYRSKFGFLPQDFGYHRDFTVKDYLEYMAALKDIPTRATTKNINLGQLQIILAAAGLLSVLATVSCTLFLSAKCKDTLTVLLISIVVLLMPLFAYVAMGATWLSTILPSAGIGMQNNFLSQLADFNYLNIGGMSFWTPQIILLSAGIELFVFIFLAIHSYCRHQVA